MTRWSLSANKSGFGLGLSLVWTWQVLSHCTQLSCDCTKICGLRPQLIPLIRSESSYLLEALAVSNTVCVFSCVRLCNLMDYSLPGSSVHGIHQARILEWVAMPSSRRSSRRQGSDPHLLCLLHWQADSLPLSHLESPKFDTPPYQGIKPQFPTWQMGILTTILMRSGATNQSPSVHLS